MGDWTSQGFLDAAHAWIRAQTARLSLSVDGEIEQIHVQPWSTVLRVPTRGGPLYFKANHDALRHEAAIVELLSARRPDFVPPPLALDLDRGWMLMADAGLRLRELVEGERSLDPWLKLLPLYAELQLEASDAVSELVALGTPDMRLDVLPAKFDRLLDEVSGLEDMPSGVVERARDRASSVGEMSEALHRYGIPETIQHDDLNDGQAYVLDGRPLLLDWGDACVSHPFFSMSVALEGVIAWGLDDEENSVDTAPFRDAYLRPFADRLGRSMDELQAACRIAIRLGWACRAVNGHVRGIDPTPTARRLEMFLAGRVDA
jgi:hypothetical protein